MDRMGVVDALLNRLGLVQRYSLQQWISESFSYGGHQYPVMPMQTLNGDKQERPSGSFESYVKGVYKRNGVVFACMSARMLMFSEARFQFRRFDAGRPEELFGTEALKLLEKPWTNATTGDLLARMIQDVDLGGNGYSVLRRGELRRPRPDWMTIVIGSPNTATDNPGDDLDAEIAGYFYHRGGVDVDKDPIFLTPRQVAHFAPYPDPAFRFRGMSPLTPVLQDVLGDEAATEHKTRYFENGATPNMIVALDKTFDKKETYDAFIKKMREEHEGVANAYKTLYLGSGATATVVGSNLQQIDFKKTQGGGETRIASAMGVPPIIVGLSEGLDAATYSNYGQAKRAFANLTLSPLWRNVAGSLEHLLAVPPGAHLWYDVRDIPFLQEDQKDAADIFHVKAQSYEALIRAGADPKSSASAVDTGDILNIKHTGLFSVQLQKPGTEEPPAKPALPAPNAQPALPAGEKPTPPAAPPAPPKRDADPAEGAGGRAVRIGTAARHAAIAERLEQGQFHKDIARDLDISERTVERVAANLREMAGAVV